MDDDLCDMFKNFSTTSKPDMSCYDMFEDLPKLKCKERTQPRRECKSRLKPNKELLKRALSKLGSAIKKTDDELKTKKTKYQQVLESQKTTINDLQKLLSGEIQYAKVVLTLFDILTENKDLISESESYIKLYNEIIARKGIVTLLGDLSKSTENITSVIKELSDLSKSGELLKQSVLRNQLYIDIDGKKYERNDFWPIIARLKKRSQAIKMEEDDENDEDDKMVGGSSDIFRLYKKYCGKH